MAQGRISDDWSEVDEVASVVSFSSDPDDPISHSWPSSPSPLGHQPQSDAPATSPSPPLPISLPDNTQLRDQSPESHSPPVFSETNASSNLIDFNEDALATRHITQADPTPQFNIAATTQPDHRDILIQDGEENTSDPNTYYLSLTAAISSLEATAEKALHLGASRISTLSFLKSTCDELLKHAKELEPILATYARRWAAGSTDMSEGDMPLNPSLLEWISHLRAQLLHAQIEMDRIPRVKSEEDGEAATELSAGSIPLHVNVTLAGCAESLEDALTAIEDFMPIFKTDFDEARTRKMVIPTKAIGEQASQPRREPPRPEVARIRSELYLLKDRLRQMGVLLHQLCIPTPPTNLPEAPHVAGRLNNVTEAISTILTNHASEWLESDMQQSSRKTIAYDEFLALDPEVLYDIASHLRELYEGLVADDPEMVANYTAEMIRNHQLVLLAECGQMQELTSTAELLESLMLPRI